MESIAHKQTAAIIVAAGAGIRFGGPVRKQYLEISGKPVLQHTLARFDACAYIDEIVLVSPVDECKALQTKIKTWHIATPLQVVCGGNERYDSVFNGLNAVSVATEYVAVHDGVRPCVTVALISSLVAVAQEHGAAIPAVRPKDTVKTVHDGVVKSTLDRNGVVLVQTPQVFRRHWLIDAYKYAKSHREYGTDDASLVEAAGMPVQIVPGDYTNIKITSPEDVVLAEQFLKAI